MITITALKWVPPFAAGNVRDHRARWILNEVDWPYQVRLVDKPTLMSPEYSHLQPFGQVPALEEDGRPPLFESGAIIIDVATRAKKLIPVDESGRAQVIAWVIAALNSIEPSLMNVAEVDYFLKDEDEKAKRRPVVCEFAESRLNQLQAALGDRQWLYGDSFTIADLVMASVLKIARGVGLLEKFPQLVAYQDRCLARPAYRKAVDDQRADIAKHNMADMKFDAV